MGEVPVLTFHFLGNYFLMDLSRKCQMSIGIRHSLFVLIINKLYSSDWRVKIIFPTFHS